MSAKILVVDHDAGTQALIEVNLKRTGFESLAALDAETARRCIDKIMPDLMLLDWNLPGVTGLAFLHRLRSVVRTRSLPIIMLTARAEMADKIQGLSGGADDYMTKPFSPTELLARIRAVLRSRNPQVNGDVLEVCDLRLDPTTHRVVAAGRAVNLSPTEFRLLHFLMAHTERLHSRIQLLDKVWGNHAVAEERTVDVHIRRLRATLEATGHDALIQTVRQGGYRFSAKPAGECVCQETETLPQLRHHTR